MLDLRGLYFADRPDTQQGDRSFSIPGLSNIRFTTSSLVGNLGAPLFDANGRSHSDLSLTHSASPQPTARGPRDVDDSAGTADECVDREEDPDAEWYGDEVPKYSRDPFKEGMLHRLAIIEPRPSEHQEG